jgi:hypothetical protein
VTEIVNRSFRGSWDSAGRLSRILLITSVVLIAFAIVTAVAFPEARAGAFRNLAVALMLLINQLVAVFLTPAQQKRVVLPQLVFVVLMIVYMFAPLVGLVRQSSGTLPWDLLLVSFVPLILIVLMIRRTDTR